MSFSTYLSFSSLYEIEQATTNTPSSRSSRGGQSGGVLRRDSNSSTSSRGSSSTDSDSDSGRRVHFANSSSTSLSSSASSIYQSHSDKLHTNSKRYSTEDGSLPGASQLQFLSDDQDLSLRRFGRR